MNVVDAVDVRQFTDLRLGYSITRLQTDKLRSSFIDYRTGAFKAKKPISFGPCQVPTLGLVHSNDLLSLKTIKAAPLLCILFVILALCRHTVVVSSRVWQMH